MLVAYGVRIPLEAQIPWRHILHTDKKVYLPCNLNESKEVRTVCTQSVPYWSPLGTVHFQSLWHS